MFRIVLVIAAAVTAASLLATSASGAPADATRLAAEGVSSLSYSPERVYDDDDHLTVTFTTTGRAEPGRGYWVYLVIWGPDAQGGNPVGCQEDAIWGLKGKSLGGKRIVGGAGKTHTVVLRPLNLYGGGKFWCPGRAELTVGTNSFSKPEVSKARRLKTVTFRVLRAP